MSSPDKHSFVRAKFSSRKTSSASSSGSAECASASPISDGISAAADPCSTIVTSLALSRN